MEVFGLTPVDSALSVFGLNVAQALTALIFSNTKLGILGFTAAFFWCIWEMIKEGGYGKFIIFGLICISGILLIIVPQQNEPSFKSAMEDSGATVSITSKALKESQTSLNKVPVVLTFLAQGADGIVFDAIKVIDQSLSDDKKFLKNPFQMQKLSLEDHLNVNASIQDAALREDIENFIYSEYLPAYLNNNPHSYSFNLTTEPSKSLLQDLNPSWVNSRNILTHMGSATDIINKQIVSSIIKGQMHHEKGFSIWPLSLSIYTMFPYILGWANFCLYASFPIVMLILIVFRRLNIFLRYVEVFIWIKSWVLTAAFAHYTSMIVAEVQAKAASEPSWFWQYPYYTVICAVLLCLMPALSLVGIHKGFQSFNNRN